MRKIIAIQQNLKWMLPLALASLDGCKSPCVEAPSTEGCGTLSIVAEIPKIPHDNTLVAFEVHGLDPSASALPAVTLTKLDSVPGPLQNSPVQLTVQAVNQGQDPDGGSIEVSYDKSATLTGGLVKLAVSTGGRTVEANVYVYTPPKFAVGPSLTTPLVYPAQVSPVDLAVSPLNSSETAASLFVTEQYDNASQRALVKYNYDVMTRKLVADSSFGPLVISEIPGQYRGLFAVSNRAAFAYEYSPFVPAGYYLTPYQISPFMKGSSAYLGDRPMSRPNAQILAADPFTATRMLVDPSQIDVLSIDIDKGYQAVTTLATPMPLRYLVARHLDLPRGSENSSTPYSLDAVGVDQSNRIEIYRLSNAVLSAASELSQAANDATNRPGTVGLGTRNIVGLALYDIDRDGYPDIVLALQDPATKATQEIGWLRYIGGGRFDALDGSTLAPLAGPPLQGVRSLAVGDFDADGKPDIALANTSSVQVYLNQSL